MKRSLVFLVALGIAHFPIYADPVAGTASDPRSMLVVTMSIGYVVTG